MKPVTFEGGLYMYLGGCAFLLIQLSGESAKTFLSPLTLWILQTVVGYTNAMALALKMYRSTTFAAGKLNGSATPQQAAALGIVHTGHTEFITKPIEPPKTV